MAKLSKKIALDVKLRLQDIINYGNFLSTLAHADIGAAVSDLAGQVNTLLELPDFEALTSPEDGPTEPTPILQTQFGVVPPAVAAAITAAWPESLWVNAAEVAYRESGWRPDARNNTLDRGPCGTQYFIPGVGPAMTEDSIGLFQINRCAHGGTVEELQDSHNNAIMAYDIYLRQGWGAWYYSARSLELI